MTIINTKKRILTAATKIIMIAIIITIMITIIKIISYYDNN